MITYDFDDKDIKQVMWELSNRIKDIEMRIEAVPHIEERIKRMQILVTALEKAGLLEPEFKEDIDE